MNKFAETYNNMYNEAKSSIYHMQNLGLTIPDEFKISAQYALSHQFNNLLKNTNVEYIDSHIIQQAMDINFEAKRIGIDIDKSETSKIFSQKILKNVIRLANNLEVQEADAILGLFETIETLELTVDISEAQNVFYAKIFHKIGSVIAENELDTEIITFIKMLLQIGNRLNINTEFYKNQLDKALIQKMK